MNDFDQLGMSEPILRAVTRLGFSVPTPVQKQAIPLLLSSDRDMVALARTGTGKTAAFGIPLLQKLTGTTAGPEALVLAPTRELCRQITKDLQSFALYLERTGITAVYGGASMELQIRDLKTRPRVIVATPGRLIDHIRRGTVSLDDVRTLVLDEADEMLSMGFREELETILSSVPGTHQTCMFSATMSRDVRSIAERHLREPAEIAVSEESVLQIEHRYSLVHAADRIEALRRFVSLEPDMYGIVFCRTRDTAREVADILSRDGNNADALHGELSQSQRDYVMGRFRKGYVKLLVATDVAARGLDVSGLSHVLHLGLPEDADAYVHRSGRTGRAGKSGVSVAIISPRERMQLRAIEKKLDRPMKRVDAPDGTDILRARIANVMDRIELSGNEAAIPEDLLIEAGARLGTIANEDLVKGLIALTLGDRLSVYGNAAKLVVPDRDSRGGREYAGRRDGRPSGNGAAGYRNREFRDRDNGGRDFARTNTPMNRTTESNRTHEFRPGRGTEPWKRKDRETVPEPGRTPGNGFSDMVETKLPFGEADGLTKPMLLELINRKMGRVRFPVGRIRIMKHFSVIEVPESIARELVSRLQGVTGGKIPR